MENKGNKSEGIGLFTCITVIIGSMVGSAIFSLSGLTMYQAGPSAIVSWVIAALVMLVYGLICSELASVFPKSGGAYVFPAKAFNSKFLGWISTWGYINGNTVAIAFSAIYVGTYLGAGFGLDDKWQVPLAIAAIAICLILNCMNFSLAGKFNSGLVILLLVSMVIYIVSCFTSGNWNSAFIVPFFGQGAGGKTGFMTAVPTAMLAYGSIVSIAFMVSEVRNPSRNVPRAVLIAMIIVASVYCLIITATLGIVSASFLEQNPGMRYIPLYAACFTGLSSIKWLAKVVSIAAVLALLTTMLFVTALTARALQAASQDGLFVKALGKNNRFGVPALSAISISTVAAVISCFPSFTEWIVNFGALFGAVTICINIVSLFKTRKLGLERSFRAPGGRILPLIALVLIILCYVPDIVSGGIMLWVYSIVWYLVGILIFFARKS